MPISQIGSNGLGSGAVTSAKLAAAQTLSVNGVTFPATQVPSADANTLDDYEEGTFTPAVRGASTAGTYTGNFSGIYTKIGRVVTVFVFIQPNTSATGGTGYFQVTGMPFTNANQGVGSIFLSNVNMSDTAKSWVPLFISGSGVSIIYVSEAYDNSASGDMPVSTISTSTVLQISLTYFTS
jgi:hypothetical protein